MSVATVSVETLRRELHRVVDGINHWTAPRWAVQVDGQPRADYLRAQLQEIADLAAEAECRPAQLVPALENTAALPDQLVVLTEDLLAIASPDGLIRISAIFANIRHTLLS